jgi:RimJ/RimL family protein N-acetyltransferase
VAEVFTTPRLRVREWTHSESDLDRLYDIYSRWEVARWLGATPKALESRELAPAVVDRWAGRSDGPYGIWAVEVIDTNVVAGTVLLVTLPESTEVEVGWHFHPDSWGHGYATESARGAIERGFTVGGLDEIYAVVRPDNAPSIAVCRRLGMEALGRTDRWYDSSLEAFRLKAAG